MKEFKQRIVTVQQSTVQVQSASGNIYPVTIADRIRLSDRTPEVGDTAIVHRVNGRYYLYDFVKKVDETDSYLAEMPLDELYGVY